MAHELAFCCRDDSHRKREKTEHIDIGKLFMKFNNIHPKHTTHTLMYQLYTRQHIISLDWRVLCGKHYNTIFASLTNVSLD